MVSLKIVSSTLNSPIKQFAEVLLIISYRRSIAFSQAAVAGFRQIGSGGAQFDGSSLRLPDGRYEQATEHCQQQTWYHLDQHGVDPEVQLRDGYAVQRAGRCIDRRNGHQVVRLVAPTLTLCILITRTHTRMHIIFVRGQDIWTTPRHVTVRPL